jgi:hypothetical protein
MCQYACLSLYVYSLRVALTRPAVDMIMIELKGMYAQDQPNVEAAMRIAENAANIVKRGVRPPPPVPALVPVRVYVYAYLSAGVYNASQNGFIYRAESQLGTELLPGEKAELTSASTRYFPDNYSSVSARLIGRIYLRPYIGLSHARLSQRSGHLVHEARPAGPWRCLWPPRNHPFKLWQFPMRSFPDMVVG